MPVQEREPAGFPAREAEENLRVIRSFMERSTRYSTFSGPSGILAGSFAILGCLIHRFIVAPLHQDARPVAMLANWSLVIVAAIAADYVLTKRRARLVGKYIRSHLGRQILLASAPALGLGVLITLYLCSIRRLDEVFPFWMLSYGAAVCAVGLFSQREVSRLGWAFMAAGVITLAIRLLITGGAWIAIALLMMAISFGGFHIAYGFAVSGKEDR
jgi:hypothetical protein